MLLVDVAFELSASGLQGKDSEIKINHQTVASGNKNTLIASQLTVPSTGEVLITVEQNGKRVLHKNLIALPGWVSLLPPLAAILLAFLLRSVIPALFIGLWVGAWAVNGLTVASLIPSFFDSITVYVVNTATDSGHMSIIVFSLLIGGMVGIISRNGGMVGIVHKIMPFASSPRRGQAVVATLGVAIFFDDYANTMIVGNATRPISDQLRISREKLAYLVDSTSAPIAAIAIITTWIGFEIGIIESAIANLDGITGSAYLLFLHSLPYNFYPFLAIAFVYIVVVTKRDFGPMYKAEVRARQTGVVALSQGKEASIDEFCHKDEIPCRAINAILPIGAMVVSVVSGLFISGEGATLTDIIGSADAYLVLIWASLVGCLVAVILSLSQGLLSLDETVDAWLAGARFMLSGLVLLVLAWAVGDVAGVLQTAPFLVSVLGDSLSAASLPAIIFILAALTAFATGSSWGVMAILMPMAIPLCWAVMLSEGIADVEHMHIFYSAIACVLAGAVWGDHCSPISDTTVLSSLATGCNHMDHVKTQLPYALFTGITGTLLCTLPVGYGAPWWLMLILAVVFLSVVHRYFGKTVEAAQTTI